MLVSGHVSPEAFVGSLSGEVAADDQLVFSYESAEMRCRSSQEVNNPVEW
jgi:dihydroxyacid dehydratase/phosphogluconate dehydratase